MAHRIHTLVAASLVIAAAAGCRPRLDEVSVPPRAEPAATQGVQACWVESRARFGFTASSLLVRHPEGDLLIDAGNSTHFDDEIEAYEGSTKRWLATFPGALKPKRSLAEELRAVHVDPAGLRWVLPTHAHLDHLGGVVDLPPTPVLLDDAEAAVVEHGREEVTFEVIPAHARAVEGHVEPLELKPEPYEIFERHADLFGDGSVVVVPLPGHTPGSVGVFVRLLDGRRVFHVGDAVNDRKQITHLRGRTAAMRRTDSDRDAAEHTVARLHGLAEQSDVLFLPAHERAAWEAVFGRPGAPCERAPTD